MLVQEVTLARRKSINSDAITFDALVIRKLKSDIDRANIVVIEDVNATVASLVTRLFLRIRQRHWVFNTIPDLLNALNERVTHQVHDGIGHSKVVRRDQRLKIY